MALPRQHGAGQPADHIMLWIMVYNSWSHQPTCLWIQLPGVEGHLLKETSLCYRHQDLQLNYTTSPYNSSCPVLISLDNYIFLRAEGNQQAMPTEHASRNLRLSTSTLKAGGALGAALIWTAAALSVKSKETWRLILLKSICWLFG